jgi:hypothetical protein
MVVCGFISSRENQAVVIMSYEFMYHADDKFKKLRKKANKMVQTNFESMVRLLQISFSFESLIAINKLEIERDRSSSKTSTTIHCRSR